MPNKGFFNEMFAHVDAMDAQGFTNCFTEDAVFRFGNNDAVVGSAKIQEFIGGFFGAIGGISHDFQNCLHPISWAMEGMPARVASGREGCNLVSSFVKQSDLQRLGCRHTCLSSSRFQLRNIGCMGSLLDTESPRRISRSRLGDIEHMT